MGPTNDVFLCGAALPAFANQFQQPHRRTQSYLVDNLPALSALQKFVTFRHTSASPDILQIVESPSQYTERKLA